MKETISFLLRDKRALPAVLALLLATVGLFFLLSGTSSVPPAVESPPPEVQELDLRGQDVTVDEVRRLQAEHPGCHIRWDVPVGGGRFDSESRAIAVPDYTAADREALEFFPHLKSVDCSGSTDYPALLSLWEEKPDVSVTWTVPVGGRELPSDAVSLLLGKETVPAAALEESLRAFPALRRVIMDDCPYSDGEKASLRQAFPQITFRWPVEVCGEDFLSTAEEISFAGREDMDESSLREIRQRVDQFFALERVDLTDCGFEGGELHKLDEALGDIDVVWTFDLYGVTVRSTDEEIDVSRQVIWDNGRAVEDVIPWMPHLKKVVMCEVNISDKDMDALNQKYLPQGVRFVWMVQIKWAGIRTDSTYFIPYAESGVRQYPSMAGLSALQYCPDLIALDIGHSNIKGLDYLRIMPHLKYLILADNWLVDITDVGTLKELTWLELFKTAVTDITPLLNCTSLEHLNICYILAPGDELYDTLRQMTWLKRLWCCGTFMSDEQLAQLKQDLPNCEIWDKMGDESTGSTWRYDDAYYEMRDAFHMYYMSLDGNTVGRLSEEELQAVHDEFWGAAG